MACALKKNQIDYHRRIGAWFDHYLKGAPAQAVDHERGERAGARRTMKAFSRRV